MTTSDLTAGFVDFLQEARGREPFPWQLRLVEWLVEGRWPDVIDIPTGLGKTSVIDAWVYALGMRRLEAADPGPFPHRLFFVVDRRIIVDEAHQHARDLAGRLTEADPGTAVGRVAEGLRRLTDGAAEPLSCVRMRGGVTWESRWLARPDQAAVVTGTVDQLGSRLLFRGYGASPRMRPVDAALVGVDAWVVVDEAHIAEPLRRTVDQVRSLQAAHPGSLADRGLRVTFMSATPSLEGSRLTADVASETGDERVPAAAAVARQRLTTSKPAALVELAWLKPKRSSGWRQRSQDLGEALAHLAQRSAAAAKVVGVIANTISTARAAFDRLEADGETAALLTGRCRAYEREQIEESDTFAAAKLGEDRPFEGRRFLVATQTVEVGVNLDLDLVVTEAAPLASLIQRFGRVNRAGERHPQLSVIAYAPFAHDDDPIYGKATANSWGWLTERGAPVEIPRARDLAGADLAPVLDLGPSELPRLTADTSGDLRPDPGLIPMVLGSHVERWAHTNPAPEPDQPVAPFLHGAERGLPEVAVAWRARPPAPNEPLDGEEGDVDAHTWDRWLDLARPTSWEFVDVPIWEMRALLAGTATDVPTADVEGALVSEEGDDTAQAEEVLGVVYRGPAEVVPIRRPSDVRPGDRVVLAADVGGHDDWGWVGAMPDRRMVRDVADLAVRRRDGGRASLRLSQRVLTAWDPERGLELWAQIMELTEPDDRDQERFQADDEEVGKVVTLLDEAGFPHRLTGEGSEAIPSGFRECWILKSGPGTESVVSSFVSDDDEASTSMLPTRVGLFAHGANVEVLAREMATNLGLDDTVVDAVGVAARYHDLGKADRRFQAMLRLADPLQGLGDGGLLAKSGADPRDPESRRAAWLAGVPRGFRHEGVSAHLVTQLLESGAVAADVDPELVVHLVAAHHGHARPLLPAVPGPDVEPTEVEVDGHTVVHAPRRSQVDWSQPARFERLNQRYGWWGLALLEAIVRLADIRCSEEGK